MKDFHTKEMYEISFTGQEYDNFFKKFDLTNIGMFESILYFAGFNYDSKELIDSIKTAWDKAIKTYNYYPRQRSFNRILKLLKKKELLLLYRITEEAEMCSSCDERYALYNEYLSNTLGIIESELIARSGSYQIIKENK